MISVVEQIRASRIFKLVMAIYIEKRPLWSILNSFYYSHRSWLEQRGFSKCEKRKAEIGNRKI